VSGHHWRYLQSIAPTLMCLSTISSLQLWASTSTQAGAGSEAPKFFNWQSPARLHHSLRATSGDLIFTGDGIEFRSDDKRFSNHWPYSEVKTFDLASRRLVITDYENRGHYLPGERRFRFDLVTSVPPSVAVQLAQRVGKPARNGDPDPKSTAFFTIQARHGKRFGGTNGLLRFREEGIDYTTTGGVGSRSWRWEDIQTLANPDSYQLRVGAYRDVFEFELKEPLPRDVFERLWDKVYANNLKGLADGTNQEKHEPMQRQLN
jgi:hypothetical protein